MRYVLPANVSTSNDYIYIYIVLCTFTTKFVTIREYGSTLYVGMVPKTNGPYISIATNELKSLLIYYTDEFKYTHTF